MKNVPIVFASNNHIASWFIKLGTLSHWSHCAILDGEYIIDTTLLTGVRRIPVYEWIKNYPRYEVLYAPNRDPEGSINFARNQVGKSYDWLGIFSFIFRNNYEDKNKWFCSELVATYLGVVHTPYRLSPAFLYRLTKALRGWIS